MPLNSKPFKVGTEVTYEYDPYPDDFYHIVTYKRVKGKIKEVLWGDVPKDDYYKRVDFLYIIEFPIETQLIERVVSHFQLQGMGNYVTD